jgi:hypothetical protein
MHVGRSAGNASRFGLQTTARPWPVETEADFHCETGHISSRTKAAERHTFVRASSLFVYLLPVDCVVIWSSSHCQLL